MLLFCFDLILIGEKQKGIKELDFHAIFTIGIGIDFKDYKDLEDSCHKVINLDQKRKQFDLQAQKRQSWKRNQVVPADDQN